MNIKTLVIDDSLDWRLTLSKFVQLHPALALVGTCESGPEAYAFLQQQSVDLLICDIEMPDLSGLGLARQLHQAPLIIFVTAHQHYALESFEVSPVDFMVKPLDYERFMASIDKVCKRLESHVPASSISPYFFIREAHDYIQVQYQDVLYMKAREHFVEIVTPTRTYLPLLSISKLEGQLAGDVFLRVNRSYLVNRSAIAVIGRHELQLITGEVIPIGDQYRAAINRLHINQHLLSNRVAKP